MAFFRGLVQHCQDLQLTFKGKRIADVGTGTGYLLRALHQAEPDSQLFGFDTFGEMLDLGRMLCPGAIFSTTSLYKLSDDFELVFCTETLEHLVEPHVALKALAHRLTPGGTLVLTVPDGRMDQHQPLQPREDGTAYWGHINFWSPESWSLFLHRELGNGIQYEIVCQQLDTGQNLGLVTRR